MASVNKVIIVGNLGNAPTTRYLPSGEQIVSISVATTRKIKEQEETEWHRISLFGKLAEIAGKYLAKGSQVYVEGRLRTRKYTDKSGIERFSTEIIADVLQILGNRNTDSNHQQPGPKRNSYAEAKQTGSRHMPADVPDDDIPF